VIYEIQLAIEIALENFWKLKAIDSFQAADSTLSKEEQTKVFDVLIKREDQRSHFCKNELIIHLRQEYVSKGGLEAL
jgi:hypothetical protein